MDTGRDFILLPLNELFSWCRLSLGPFQLQLQLQLNDPQESPVNAERMTPSERINSSSRYETSRPNISPDFCFKRLRLAYHSTEHKPLEKQAAGSRWETGPLRRGKEWTARKRRRQGPKSRLKVESDCHPPACQWAASNAKSVNSSLAFISKCWCLERTSNCKPRIDISMRKGNRALSVSQKSVSRMIWCTLYSAEESWKRRMMIVF